jgi:hypothetical protein
MAKIYEWTVWNNNAGETQPGPRKGTLEAITLCKGAPVLESEEEIADILLDGDGFVKKTS